MSELWEAVCTTISASYGADYNKHRYKFDFFSNVLQHAEQQRIDYLELGSFEGVSMAVVLSLLKSRGQLGRAVSIDPYFDDGYMEVKPGGDHARKYSTPLVMEKAQRLYRELGFEVELIRGTSLEAAKSLAGQQFDLIFVDGRHEGTWPIYDIGLSLGLLQHGGILCLDDIERPDITPIVTILDRYLSCLHRTPYRVAFRFEGMVP